MKTLYSSLILALTLSLSAAAEITITADPPTLTGASEKPVTLRYKFTKGNKVNLLMDMEMTTSMTMGGQKMHMPITMIMEGAYTVKSVDTEGNGVVILTFTRMAMEMKAPIHMSFDSNKEADRNNPQFKPMLGVLNIPIDTTISPRGAVVAMNMDTVNDAMVKAGAMTAAEAKQNTEKMMQGSFIQLPEEAIAVGQTYDAGEVVQDAKGVGKMRSKINYTISAVSGDESLVLLTPKGSLALEPTPGSPMTVTMKASKMSGWVLFDRTKGNVTKSYVAVEADMDMQQGQQNISMQMDIKVKYTTK